MILLKWRNHDNLWERKKVIMMTEATGPAKMSTFVNIVALGWHKSWQ